MTYMYDRTGKYSLDRFKDIFIGKLKGLDAWIMTFDVLDNSWKFGEIIPMFSDSSIDFYFLIFSINLIIFA